MTKESAEFIHKMAEKAFADQSSTDHVLEDIYRYAIPHRNAYTTDARKTDFIFDSTAVNAVQRGANRLQTDLTPPFQRWGELKAGPAIRKEDRAQLDVELEQVTMVCHATFNAGGFITGSHEVYQDLFAGQGHMMVLEGDDRRPVEYIAIPASEVATVEGVRGRMEGWFRRNKIRASLLARTWKGAKIPASLQSKIDSDSEGKLEVIIYTAITFDGEENVWRLQVVLKDGEHAEIFDEEFDYQPVISPRWSKLAGDPRGRGPLHLALPDIKTANKVVELVLKNAALSIVGVYTAVDDGIVNPDTIRIVPGAVIGVESNGSTGRGASLKALETSRQFDVSQLVLQDLRQSIKTILMDTQLPPEAGAVRSPTEIVAKLKELAQNTGAAFGRLYEEWIVPLFEATIAILVKKGILGTKIPLDQINFKVQVVSPLAKLQQLQDIDAAVQYLGIATQVAGQEAALLTTKIEELLPWIADQLGVPGRFIRSPAESARMQEQMAAIVAGSGQDNGGIGARGGAEAIPVRAAA